LISSDIGVKKPSVEAFEIALKTFNIDKENSIYVGNDMRDDILGASCAGLRTLYIHTEQSGSYPELDIPSPTYTVKNHSEMKARLLSLI
ncbi:MAG: HAD family hydrolase, partial [Clostridia bacterium]|nr:HAD family hydrolase [Clostridia bacterium]